MSGTTQLLTFNTVGAPTVGEPDTTSKQDRARAHGARATWAESYCSSRCLFCYSKIEPELTEPELLELILYVLEQNSTRARGAGVLEPRVVWILDTGFLSQLMIYIGICGPPTLIDRLWFECKTSSTIGVLCISFNYVYSFTLFSTAYWCDLYIYCFAIRCVDDATLGA